MPKAIPVSSMLGAKFGLWTVLSFSHTAVKQFPGGIRQRRSYFKCACECGAEKIMDMYVLRCGGSRSCGCAYVTSLRTGRMPGDPPVTNLKVEYQAWINMKRRCYDPKAKDYQNYSKKGITVCEEWRNSFRAFHRDMGSRPEGMKSIDRIDNNKGYSKENCRWATLLQQANNMSTNRVYEYNGESGTAPFWARKYGISLATMHARLNWHGWSIERAIVPPNRKKSKAK